MNFYQFKNMNEVTIEHIYKVKALKQLILRLDDSVYKLLCIKILLPGFILSLFVLYP